ISFPSFIGLAKHGTKGFLIFHIHIYEKLFHLICKKLRFIPINCLKDYLKRNKNKIKRNFHKWGFSFIPHLWLVEPIGPLHVLEVEVLLSVKSEIKESLKR
ncbi:hypothetical protein A499_02240, partial [Niallia nealsonii AAU1]